MHHVCMASRYKHLNYIFLLLHASVACAFLIKSNRLGFFCSSFNKPVKMTITTWKYATTLHDYTNRDDESLCSVKEVVNDGCCQELAVGIPVSCCRIDDDNPLWVDLVKLFDLQDKDACNYYYTGDYSYYGYVVWIISDYTNVLYTL